ncbi:asparaginase [Corynebacterium propinquum]|uniref:asparaginase n=1 Tax=Corynebacterium propinquum TaxID=43769 RepID=A0ABT7G4D8_9CORY|nr:asparaginase [Corynebacterium propinquum]MDK4238263.1 asparaginase [Corynebacterium propinquum]MDK4301141.1 asparaginase [Corynebacterium propinquum]MDK4312722.1 asparaginase [Corynebacterium propinquum]WKS31652.1 asparaginase [Corynebacterium propinquum]WKS36621.1 asparaginase [Corynebacterium propinquum]
MTRQIAIICTGGTIACTADHTGALVPTVSGRQLVDAARNSLADDLSFRIHDTLQLDSSSIGLPELDTLLTTIAEHAADPEVDAVVVTHGTDSMEESAFATALLVHGAPVVFTGAQRAFDHPDTDGPGNLAGAINRALELAASTRGSASAQPASMAMSTVEVHFAGKNLPATAVHKRHTSELAAFTAHGPAVSVDASALSSPSSASSVIPVLSGYFVPVIAGYPGATPELLEHAVDAGADGLVIEALGSGNMSAELGHAAQRAVQQGIPVVVATRVPEGAVKLAYGGGGGGATLAEYGAVSARTVHPGQARLALIIALATGINPEELFRCFD